MGPRRSHRALGLVLSGVGAVALSCRLEAPPQAASIAPAPAPSLPVPTLAPPRPLRRCLPDVPIWVDPPLSMLFAGARAHLGGNDADGSLACAEEAARQAPRSVQAHHDRALALLGLGRFDEARDAIELVLTLAPRDPAALALSADLNINHLAPSADRTASGLERARLGRRLAPPSDRPLLARLGLLEAQALIDLGRAAEALGPLEASRRFDPDSVAVTYEQGVALFELCRFDDAMVAFSAVIRRQPDHVHAIYHLGLVLERSASPAQSEALLAQAAGLDPKSFPAAPHSSPHDFASRVARILSALPSDLRADLKGIPVENAELPGLADLIAEHPPLSPTILGLYRGFPLGRDEGPAPSALGRTPLAKKGRAAAPVADTTLDGDIPARAIVLYRKNLLRSISKLSELDAAIERTLLHEIGHLRGEDDGSLRDRGLE